MARKKHLSNKSLITLCDLGKLAPYNGIRSFVNNLAPKWPEGRQILYDLLINSNLWSEAIFTNTIVLARKEYSVMEIKLSLSLSPKKIQDFFNLIKDWPSMPPATNFGGGFRHSTISEKIFRTNLYDPENIPIEQLNYTRFWYSKRDKKL